MLEGGRLAAGTWPLVRRCSRVEAAHDRPREFGGRTDLSTNSRARGAGAEALIVLLLAALALVFWKVQLFDPPPRDDFVVDLRNADLFMEVAPLARETTRQWLDGRLPLWNPYQSAGRPLLALPMAAALYPPHAIYALLPAPVAVEVLIVLHLAAFGIFTYAFARSLSLSRLAAFASGLCITLSGFAIAVATWTPTAVASCAWLPLALLAVERIVAAPRARWLALLALAVCMPLLAGWIQIWTYSMYALGLYALLRLSQRARGDLPLAARIAAWLAAGVVLGIGVAALQILPGQELQQMSARPGPLTPSQHNPHDTHEISQLAEQMTVPTPGEPRHAYLGIASLILLPLSLLARGRWVPVLCFGSLGLLALAVGVHAGTVDLLRVVPGFSWFRYPQRMVFLYAFGGAVLVGAAVDDLLRGGERGRALLLTAVVLSVAAALQSRAPLGHAGSAFLWSSAILIILALHAPSAPARSALVSVLIAVLGIDLFRASQTLLPRPIHAPAVVEGERGLYTYLRDHQGLGRSLMSTRSLATKDLRATGERIYSIGDYSALTLGRQGAFFDRIERYERDERFPFMGNFVPDPESPSLGILELTSLRFIVADPRESAPLRQAFGRRSVEWREVYRSDGPHSVYEHPAPLPRAYVAFRSVEAADAAAALAAICAPDFDPRQAVVVEGGRLAPRPSAPRAIQPVPITSYGPQEVTLETSTDEAGMLVLTDSDYPGWVAEIDGHRTGILTANFLFRAVALPAGSHRVTFRYAPRSVRIGVAISLASLSLLAAALVLEPRPAPANPPVEGRT